MSQKTPIKVARLRNTIIAVAVTIVIAIIALGVYYTTDVSTGDTFVEGKHYTVLSDAPALVSGAPVVVREYFSYGCIHCKNFDPQVEQWREHMPANVQFERTPVAFSPVWGILARSYYTLASVGALEENHPRLFRAIHDNGRQFLSPAMVADFVDGHGVSRDEFLRVYDSPAVVRAAKEGDVRARAEKIDSVPSLVVADRYVINMTEVSRSQAFAVVDFLVAKVNKGA